MRYAVGISIAILFLITSISYIIYLCRHYSVAPPPLQPKHNVQTGLDNAMLRSWPMLTYAEAKNTDPRVADANCCSICLVDYEEEEEDLRLLPDCRHLFHASCVGLWLRRRPTCPVCRSLVVNGAMRTPVAEAVSLEIEHA